jgi:hypothetical protein
VSTRHSDGARRRPLHPQMSAVLTDTRTTGHGKPVTHSKRNTSLRSPALRAARSRSPATADTSSYTLALSIRAGRDSWCATQWCRCAKPTKRMQCLELLKENRFLQAALHTCGRRGSSWSMTRHGRRSPEHGSSPPARITPARRIGSSRPGGTT